ncbi:unnamed protein product [Microthlaspi erraticum]|uniref:F-box domain-containing protein n=1 Tax=Microthlaspi erraticum TaxID=1685480 RepID=A0A6D2L5M6_9BRAS|nr:unnamed protein product [Microthlaspi erraticum]
MISDLPLDLESEILSRVPSKSLAKLKTTCKRWYALFKDPKFVKKNLSKAVKEVLLLDFKVYSVAINLHGINNIVDPSMEITGKLSRLEDSKALEIYEIFHCDGLILCTMGENISHVVWNPCTCETRMIKPTNLDRKDCAYFLGYGNNNSSCYNYKILRIYSKITGQIGYFEFEIYDLISDSWRVLNDVYHWFTYFLYAVSLKGNTYWIVSDLDAGHGVVLLSFDFTTERFVSFPLPYPSRNIEEGLSVVGEEQLAVLYQITNTLSFSSESEIEVWLTNKIDEAKEVSWSKFVVDFHKGIPPSVLGMTFLLDEENKVVVCCRKDIEHERSLSSVYIVGEDFHKQVYKEIAKRSSFRVLPRILSYVPSLVRIPKAKE